MTIIFSSFQLLIRCVLYSRDAQSFNFFTLPQNCIVTINFNSDMDNMKCLNCILNAFLIKSINQSQSHCVCVCVCVCVSVSV